MAAGSGSWLGTTSGRSSPATPSRSPASMRSWRTPPSRRSATTSVAARSGSFLGDLIRPRLKAEAFARRYPDGRGRCRAETGGWRTWPDGRQTIGCRPLPPAVRPPAPGACRRGGVGPSTVLVSVADDGRAGRQLRRRCGHRRRRRPRPRALPDIVDRRGRRPMTDQHRTTTTPVRDADHVGRGPPPPESSTSTLAPRGGATPSTRSTTPRRGDSRRDRAEGDHSAGDPPPSPPTHDSARHTHHRAAPAADDRRPRRHHHDHDRHGAQLMATRLLPARCTRALLRVMGSRRAPRARRWRSDAARRRTRAPRAARSALEPLPPVERAVPARRAARVVRSSCRATRSR